MRTPSADKNYGACNALVDPHANQASSQALYTDQELFIDGHLQAALGELRAAARLADVYFPQQPDHPARTALTALIDSYDSFLTEVSTRNLQAAIKQAKATGSIR